MIRFDPECHATKPLGWSGRNQWPEVEVPFKAAEGKLGNERYVDVPLMLSGAVPNVVYCAWLMKRNGSGHRYRVGRSHWVLAAIMAVFCSNSIASRASESELKKFVEVAS